MRNTLLIVCLVCLVGTLTHARLAVAENEKPKVKKEAVAASQEKAADAQEAAKEATPKAKPAEDASKNEEKTPAKQATKDDQSAKKDNAEKPEEPAKKDDKSAEKDDAKKPKEPTEKKATLARLTLRGSLPEAQVQPGLFGELEESLLRTIARLDMAAEDEKISAVVLKIRNPSIGRGKLQELRAAIARVRKADKKVYAHLVSAMPADYLLATACDEIVMPESGVLILPGIRAEITFYKGLFDKLDIKADMLQIGKFKGAAEPYTREGMSRDFRRQYQRVVDDLYEQMVDTIAEARGLDRRTVRELIDRGLFVPSEAKKAGLIDRVAYSDEFQERLKKQLSVDRITFIDDYKKKKVDTDFSGMLGMVKLLEMMAGGKSSGRSSKNKKIAVVYAVGVITSGKSSSSIFGTETLGSDSIVAALRKADEDDTVAGIVLRVDSPGGSATASDMIWHELRRIEKPVVASMGDVAASGGYYISVGCDKIYAEPGTLTGSIGVVGGKLVLGGLYDKIGLSTDVISRGKNSGLFSDTAPFTDSERSVMLKMMRTTYRQFVGRVAAGRKMTRRDLAPLAAGRIWTGQQAKDSGLVDRLGTLKDAVADVRRMAGIAEEEKVEILVLPKPRSLFEQLFGGSSTRLRAAPAIDAVLPGASEYLGDLETLRQLFAEPSLLLLPYRVRIR